MQTVRQNNHQSFRTTVTHFVSSFARSLASKSQSITSFHTGNRAATMPMVSPSPLPGTIVQHLDAGDQISQLHFLSPTPNSTLHPSLQDGNETICNKPKRRDCTKCHHRIAASCKVCSRDSISAAPLSRHARCPGNKCL